MSAIAESRKLMVSASRLLEGFGLIALAGIMLITLVDILGDKLFGRPTAGSTEIIGLLQLVAVAAGLAFSKVDGAQISVDFLHTLLRGRPKAALETFCSIMVVGFWGIACWVVVDHAVGLQERGTSTYVLGIPLYPFVFWIAIACCIPTFLLYAIDLAASSSRLWKGREAR